MSYTRAIYSTFMNSVHFRVVHKLLAPRLQNTTESVKCMSRSFFFSQHDIYTFMADRDCTVALGTAVQEEMVQYIFTSMLSHQYLSHSKQQVHFQYQWRCVLGSQFHLNKASVWGTYTGNLFEGSSRSNCITNSQLFPMGEFCLARNSFYCRSVKLVKQRNGFMPQTVLCVGHSMIKGIPAENVFGGVCSPGAPSIPFGAMTVNYVVQVGGEVNEADESSLKHAISKRTLFMDRSSSPTLLPSGE